MKLVEECKKNKVLEITLLRPRSTGLRKTNSSLLHRTKVGKLHLSYDKHGKLHFGYCEEVKQRSEIRELKVKESTSLVPIRPSDLRPSCVDVWLTCGARHLKRNNGKLYYELQLDEFFLNPQIGWLTEEFHDMLWRTDAPEGDGDDMPGVGDDACGWACDGVRCKKWHAGSDGEAEWPRNWLPNDVIGLAVDFEAQQMKFSLNGEWVESASMTFDLGSHELFPAVSIAGPFAMNILKQTWKFAPPDADYIAWADSGTFDRPDGKVESEVSAVATEQGSRDLEDLPRYASIVADADQECIAVCMEDPKVVTA